MTDSGNFERLGPAGQRPASECGPRGGTGVAFCARPVPAQHLPGRKTCRAYKIVNAHTGGITYEMATCGSYVSRTITRTADGLKVPRARNKQAEGT